MTDTVVVTGGYYPNGNTVVRYRHQGWLEDLPDLITARSSHACSSFVSSGRVVSKYEGGLQDFKRDFSESFFTVCNLALKVSGLCSF